MPGRDGDAVTDNGEQMWKAAEHTDQAWLAALSLGAQELHVAGAPAFKCAIHPRCPYAKNNFWVKF